MWDVGPPGEFRVEAWEVGCLGCGILFWGCGPGWGAGPAAGI